MIEFHSIICNSILFIILFISDPKDAVIVKVYELRPDGSVIVPPGGNLKLNCLALGKLYNVISDYN